MEDLTGNEYHPKSIFLAKEKLLNLTSAATFSVQHFNTGPFVNWDLFRFLICSQENSHYF